MSNNKDKEQQHPRVDSLQALLKFAIQQTKSEDAPNESAFEKMDPEKRQFLEEALKSYTVDIIQELQKAIHILQSSDSSIDEKLQSLEMIDELAGDIDLANNFLKIGGANIIVLCLDCEDSRIRTSAIDLIGEITQNNPFAQAHFTEIDIIPRLIKLLKDDDLNVIRSTLHAISCLVRKYEPALAIYVEKNGLELILDCLKLSTANEKLLTKAAFLVDALCVEFTEVREKFTKLGAILILANCLTSSIQSFEGNYDAKIEQLLSALKTISESKQAKEKFKAIENIQSSLKHIIDLCQTKEECEEIRNHSQYLLDFLKGKINTIVQRPGPPNMQVSLWQEGATRN